jgi:hypothetical protein
MFVTLVTANIRAMFENIKEAEFYSKLKLIPGILERSKTTSRHAKISYLKQESMNLIGSQLPVNGQQFDLFCILQ